MKSEDFFSTYFKYEENISIMDLIQTLDVDSNLCAIPVSNITIKSKAPTPYLTILVKPTASSQAYGFLYSADTILESFGIYSLPENTRFQISSNSGEELYFYNNGDAASNSKYVEFSAHIPSISATATLSIPQSYFDALTEESETAARNTLLLSVFIGIILCILFSYIGVKPFHFLLAEHSLKREDDKNEVEAIDRFLKQTKQSNQLLRGMLLSSVLARAFHELPIKENESEGLVKDFPVFQKSLRLALVRDLYPAQDKDSHSALFDTLRDSLPGNTICEHMSMSEICIIVETDLVSYETIQRIMLRINEQSEKQPRYAAGVSALFTGIHNVSTAVRQAQLCIPEDGARITGLFAENTPASPRGTLNMNFDVKHLQQELSSWNEKDTLSILHNYTKSAAQNSLAHPEEIFYNILFLLRDAARAAEMSFDAYEATAYQHHLPPAANLKQLEEIAKYLFKQKTNLQVSEIQLLSQNLVHFVKEHFSDPALSLTTLAQEFCVSERFVHKALVSVTGTNFSKLLLAVRMEEASTLLLMTNKSNAEISEACGYPAISTFYRNFKNYYEMTPAEYKESYAKKER